ncbi:zinc-dependent metalloprotease [bacterium]|nr:zinc-dependent metalloprotease [bacterium]
MNLTKKALSLLIALIAVMMAVSCTTERSAVDKTDELALDKRLFDGEFFLRQTIVDLPYTADYAFIGESSSGKVIKWKITENWLIAYSIWDKLTAVDTNEIVDVNETPIVAYPIAAHYDIVPSENPTTGEALPVLVPNTDRPWNERRYFSLATYSRSGVTNYELQYLSLTQEWGAPFYRAGLTTATDWEFYAHDGTFIVPKKYRDYTAIKDDKERYNKEVEWFQFFSTEYFEPINDWDSIYNWDDIDEFVGNEPAAVTYRFVFSKINRDVVGRRDYDIKSKTFKWTPGAKDNGFRPLEYPDEMFREYGFFTNKFKGYDNYHGYREDNYHTLANYWNMAWADANKNWNFNCGNEKDYNKCLSKIKYQQKIVFTSSPKTPLRMLPANCAITKDYNYAMLGARFAAMNPGSDTRAFDAWYFENYKNDFFKEVKGADGKTVKVRDLEWYTSNLNDPNNPHKNWREKCFVPDRQAWIQKWNGDFIDENTEDSKKMADLLEQYKNDIVVMVENPVESYVPARDGKALYGFGNYYNLSSESRENAVKICVKKDEADLYDEEKVMYLTTCYTNDDKMSELYVDKFGYPEWRGDRWDCQIFAEDENCPKDYVAVKAACVLNEERACEVEDGLPVLRHKYDNGNPYAALINWVDKPTEYGILGVSQWNVNPETGMSLGGGSNIAGSVLAWANTRAIELARVLINDDDPAAWDWKELINPDYSHTPEVIWDNKTKAASKKSVAKTSQKPYSSGNLMTMVKASSKAKTPEERLEELNREYELKTRNYDRFNFASMIGNAKWETQMVPYSIKKNLFPWMNPSDNPAYSDEQKEMMQPWFVGPAAMEAEMVKYLKAKSLDFDFDESFMDGSIIQFIKEKQKELYKKMNFELTEDGTPDWENIGEKAKKEYEEALMYAIYDPLEKMQYKGVAEHEMGHTMGLRHNFIGSTDQRNYVDNYYASENYPAMMDGIKDLLVKEQKEKGDKYNPATFGIKAYRYKKAFETDVNYYTYTSVMDYQREVYIHAVGLGKYDLAALKFVYGRSFEQFKIADDAEYGELVHQGDENDTYTGANKIHPLRDAKYPDYVRTNEQYLDENGKLKTVKVPTQLYTYYDSKGKKIERIAPKVGIGLRAKLKTDDDLNYDYDYDCDDTQAECTKNTTYLVNDGRHYEYLFITDEKSSDDPRANTFDAGFMASDVIRSMVDMDNAYYFLRFFRRGNPKFREFRGRTSMKMIYDTLFGKYKYIHFMLDYNFYVYSKWAPYILIPNANYDVPGDSTDYDDKVTVKNYLYDEYQRALNGEEYWLDANGELRTLTPMSPADYIIAGMEGINYFYFNVLYRPAVGEYMEVDASNDSDIADKLEDGQAYYFQSTENYLDGYADYMSLSTVKVDPVLGRFQKDRWDIQDNENIYYDKVLRRGYAEEKMVAIYAIANAGWFDAKYRRESRANSVDQLIEGLENVKFTMLSDVVDEEALFTFSPYCYSAETKSIVKVDVPINMLSNWAVAPLSASDDTKVYTPKKNICSQIEGKYNPVHAGWTYFDKMWPMYWTMGNVANTSADTSVLQRFVAYRINTYDIKNYPEPDVNETQFLNKDGNAYYRAVLAKSSLDIQDQTGLMKWKECNDPYDTADDDLCMKQVTFTSDGADAANAELGVTWLEEKKCVLVADENTESDKCVDEKEEDAETTNEANGVKWITTEKKCVLVDDNKTISDKCISEGDERFLAGGDVTPKEQFRRYLADKYARLSPSFRLVQSAGKLKEGEDSDLANGQEGYSRLVIMETTIDQLNSFAADNLGFAVEYASRY